MFTKISDSAFASMERDYENRMYRESYERDDEEEEEDEDDY